MKIKTMIIALSLGAVSLTALAGGRSIDLKVNTYEQKHACWCAVAVVEMWTDWINGVRVWNQDPSKQSQIAQHVYGTTDCPEDGMTVNNLADALEDYSSHWFTKYYTSSKDKFVSRIFYELNSGEPVALPVYTRFTDGRPWKDKGHYVLVDHIISNSSSNPTKESHVDYIRVNDPAYDLSAGKSLYSYIDATSPYDYISTNELFSSYVSNNYRNSYYLVRD